MLSGFYIVMINVIRIDLKYRGVGMIAGVVIVLSRGFFLLFVCWDIVVVDYFYV